MKCLFCAWVLNCDNPDELNKDNCIFILYDIICVFYLICLCMHVAI